jgi:hypothetical protein
MFNFNQTWQSRSMGKGLSKLFKEGDFMQKSGCHDKQNE